MGWYKKSLAGIVFLLFFTQIFCVGGADAAQRPLQMFLLEEEIHPEPPPLMRDGRLLIPLRFVAEAAGANVFYDGAQRMVKIENDTSVVFFWADEEKAVVNGTSEDMDVPAVLQDGRIYIPLRFWLENAGFTVNYDVQQNAVYIEEDNTPRIGARVLLFEHPVGEYYPGDAVSGSLTFKNSGNIPGKFWVGYSVKDIEERWYDVPARSVILEPGETVKVENAWPVPQDEPIVSGPFQVVMAVWDAPPGRDARRLAQAEMCGAFHVFNVKETFSFFDYERWLKENYRIGYSELKPGNVDVQDGKLRISIPAGTLEGGSIRTREHYLYGSYRASIKVPHAPSSITGFFLYKHPDFYYEIDIEIYNDNSRRIMFVTYAEGKRTNREVMRLDFDATAAFHEYRFDFYSSGVHFYVDGHLLKSWPEGLTCEPMQLMLNTWFPDWLAGTAPATDRHTYVEWIKY